MPYRSTSDLPDSIRNVLPPHAQDIFMEAFNSAWEQYDQPQERPGDSSREETAFRVAWSAVKNRYEKDEKTGEWVEK
ncbi:MAG: ChaB family protein [Anaerolineales bacterium]